MSRAVIRSFRGKHEFLSNFYAGIGGDVTIHRIHYATTEHAFQAGKFTSRKLRKQVAGCADPGSAKRYARALAVKLGGNRAGWKDADVSIYWMLYVLRLKFAHLRMRDALLETGDAMLVEGNIWGDDFWGMILVKDKWVGENWLGIILMHIRDELRTGKRRAFVPDEHRNRG